MGNSESNTEETKHSNQANELASTKFENLIFQTEEFSSRSYETEYDSSKKIKKLKKQSLQLSNKCFPNKSDKGFQRQDSVISNFDKLKIKSKQIQKLNTMFNQQIQSFHQERKIKMKYHKDHENKKSRKKRSPTEFILLGTWIGITLSMIAVLVVIIQINDLSIANQSNFSRDFPTWRGIAIWIFYLWILGFDIYMYQKFKIKYRQIFGIKQNHFPQPVNIYRIAGFHSSVFVILFLLYILDVAKIYHLPGFSEQYFAGISWIIYIGLLFLPLPTYSHKGRFFALRLLIDSMVSPFKGVTFPVTWMTDQAVSMAVPLKDLEYTICYYTEMDFKSDYNVCQDSNRVSIVMVVAVSICSIRIIQCIRQGYDQGEYFMTPFFFNTLKYTSTLLTAVLAFEYKLGADAIQSAWLLFAIISTFYSFIWDLKMDWGLLQKKQLHPLLRQKLIFGQPKIYYLIIFGNFLMRLTWILTISPQVVAFFGDSNLVFLVTGLIQIFRRGVWNLLRVQKEHIALISKPLQINHLIDQKAFQLYNKMAALEKSLGLQIKMFRFFKNLEKNRKILREDLQNVDQNSIHKNEKAVEAFNINLSQKENSNKFKV